MNTRDFFPALEQGATLLTANQRLARHARQAFNTCQQTSGHTVWASPDILPLSAWLERCWSEVVANGAPNSFPDLLTAHQHQALWQRIIAESPEGQGLLRVTSAAQDALQAWTLLRQWHITLDSWHSETNEDSRAFQRWARRFERLCKEHRWLDSASLPDVLSQQLKAQIKAGVLQLPTQIALAGFDEFTPQQQGVLDALSLAGIKITQITAPATQNNSAVRCGFPDAQAEITAAACWARHRLESNPSVTLAVVIPELGALREKVVRIFDNVFLSATLVPGGGEIAAPYNISLGTPLLDEPMIDAALLILEFTQGKLPLEKMGSLLRSPFLAGAEQEMTRRALLDARLRRFGELTVTLASLRYHATSSLDIAGRREQSSGSAYACPVLAAHLEAWAQATSTVPARQTPSHWVATFSQYLPCLGWPGERALNSREYQTGMAWRKLLADYARLDEVVGKQSLNEALAALRQIAAVTLFQPQGSDTPIQVMGMLEAAGLQFDHLWIMGWHDHAWPESPRPNPFLPLNVQRRHNVPHASAARELAFARQITQRLLNSAPQVVVSYPQHEADRDLHASPLITHLPEIPPTSPAHPATAPCVALPPASMPSPALAALVHPPCMDAQVPRWHDAKERPCTSQSLLMSAPPSYTRVIHDAARLEVISDVTGPSLATGTLVSGGTDTLKQQAACPFRAFAKHRLGAQPLSDAQIGLSASERGQLLHSVMQQIWQALQSHEALCRASERELHALINAVVTRVLHKMAHHRQFTFTARFVALEQQRLEALTAAWLALEKQRTPFIVLSSEQERTIVMAGIAFNTRIDRIDELADGRHVIIDYKTGNANLQSWFGERPDEPQLPLYGVSNPQKVAGLAFAQLRSGDMCFKGIAQEDGIIPNIKGFNGGQNINAATWEDQCQQWGQVLYGLAEGFRAGRAEVDPKKLPDTCKYCGLTALCRIHEHDGLGIAPEVEEGGDG